MSLPTLDRPRPVVLDYRGVAETYDLLRNLSGVAADGESLWTVSDEGRSVERLEQAGDGYVLAEQLALDRLFPGLPDGKEADLEAVDVEAGRVWVCGSHSRVRRKPQDGTAMSSELRSRESRHLLGHFASDGARDASGVALPYLGEGSLRQRLFADPILYTFADLPSKENGLDIEGVAVTPHRVLVGLRGPVVDSLAIVMEFSRDQGGLSDEAPVRHALKLGGLGIRDLTRWGDEILLLAGPVTAADGPFTLHQWRPMRTEAPQEATIVGEWPNGPEHPEGLCALGRDGHKGVLVVYDTREDTGRIEGSRYRADWFAMEL